MMSVRAEEAERLAEILREIFALSKTKPPNDSKPAATDDSVKLFDIQCASGSHQTCAPQVKQASDERSKPEYRDCHR
jgi:hypothetical protein